MIIRKPPTSKVKVKNTVHFLCGLRCWGLQILVGCVLLSGITWAVPLSPGPDFDLTQAARPNPPLSKILTSENAPVPSASDGIVEIVPVVSPSIVSAPPENVSPSPAPLVNKRSAVFPQTLMRNMSLTEAETLSSTNSNLSTGIIHGAEKIGQVLLDSNLLINDDSICRSEECFETGTQMPSMRRQIAEAILMSDIRNKNRAAQYWRDEALDALHTKLLQRPIEAVAKNIILFLGDGMSTATITAARILKGQKVDNLPFGEEGELHMDTFPYSGMSKTFCSDAQVADSACSATAYLCGVKANSGTIGLTPDATKNNCTAQNNPAYQLSSILAWAQAAGKSTGIISTARITHASPAGTYARISNRNWENDHEIKQDRNNPDECDDIAEQLVFGDPGRNINVILGGGRLQFLPRAKRDPENGRKGYRTDGKNLIEMWKQEKFETRHAYVEGREQLLNVDTSNVDYLLGLFAPSHMEYYHEQEKHDDPSLPEMTAIALEILSRNQNGFFLFVEGARIDHAHHLDAGLRALWETVELDRAVKKADAMTNDLDTLILVTADHSHVMTIAAFKGFVNNKRYNISKDPVDDLKYRQVPNIPRKSETHGGDDVLMSAKGPFAHLFTGTQQQSFIPHALAYAACIGSGPKFCDNVFY
ncbi:Membrane-bound alkaline phosphatase [Orchesella cincta]|uniref:Alkaline phosphatase n=1 Tax=Orchesella cincta TaxID=48709 RepID=A0A1D2NIR5_ORCCI|nr:Membrane-bound alkaline phosphatase [Orchesella cincta]